MAMGQWYNGKLEEEAGTAASDGEVGKGFQF